MLEIDNTEPHYILSGILRNKQYFVARLINLNSQNFEWYGCCLVHKCPQSTKIVIPVLGEKKR